MADLPAFSAALLRLSNIEEARFWSGGGQFEGKLGPWSTLLLEGKIFPGADSYDDPRACPVEVMGELKYRIDSQKIKGHDGHRLVADGYEPTKCTARVRIYTAAQWAAFQAYLPTISPKIPRTRQKLDAKGKPVTRAQTKALVDARGKPVIVNDNGSTYQYQTGKQVPVMESYRPSFSVSHPFLMAYGITRVYINEITLPKDGDGRMVRVVEMSMWEVWEVKKASSANVVKADVNNTSVPVIPSFQEQQPQGTVFVEPRRP